jgi:hypothetical protein
MLLKLRFAHSCGLFHHAKHELQVEDADEADATDLAVRICHGLTFQS